MYLLDLESDLQEIVNWFIDLFWSLKEYTYDQLCDVFGEQVTNLFGLGLIILIVMLVLMKIINR